MRTLALSDFRGALRRRYDGENQTGRHPDALLNELANSGYRVLRDAITEWGYDEFLTTATGNTTATPATGETFETIPFPSGAVTIRRVDLFDTPDWTPLERLNITGVRGMSARARLPVGFSVFTAGSVSGATFTTGTIALIPAGTAAVPYKVWYLPEWADISSDTHLFLYPNESCLQYHLYWCIGELCSRDRDDPGREARAMQELDPNRAGSTAHRVRAAAPRQVSAGPILFRRVENYRG